ncbi:MAG: DNA-3-methyladenine glycosylase I [Parachlamydia sp.]|nr:MAG: DNA-3-methyladenine glycosylase I [Parachlamydia sp.]
MQKSPLVRCPWVSLDNPLLVAYHDDEWGVPCHNDQKHFEFLILEGAQAGLSWDTILKRRSNYATAFAQFDPRQVALFDQNMIEKLLKNEGIIRNRLKIESTVKNAQLFLEIQQEYGSFDQYLWSFVNGQPIANHWKSLKEIPVETQEAKALSKDLKKRGFKFVGAKIIYAYMQALGLVDDHTTDCFRYHQRCK